MLVRHDECDRAGLIVSWSRSRDSALVRIRIDESRADVDVRVQRADVRFLPSSAGEKSGG